MTAVNNTLPESTLTKHQKRVYGPKSVPGGYMTVTVRHDDKCSNGHNTFSITSDVYGPHRRQGEPTITVDGRKYYLESCGCQHEEVARHFPELAEFIKWHLTSTDGPMHYIANTVYHAQQGKPDYARSSAIWPEASIEQLQDKQALTDRLPRLMQHFKTDVESLGFVY